MKQGQYTIMVKKFPKEYIGSASKEDLKELKEEGINAQMIPWIDDIDN